MRISDWSSDVCSSDLITPEEVRAFLKAEGIALERGDVVLLRTGKGASFRHPDAYKRDPAAITLETAMFLAGQGAMVVGVDLINPEPLPDRKSTRLNSSH